MRGPKNFENVTAAVKLLPPPEDALTTAVVSEFQRVYSEEVAPILEIISEKSVPPRLKPTSVTMLAPVVGSSTGAMEDNCAALYENREDRCDDWDATCN